jgi:hypothetical protein
LVSFSFVLGTVAYAASGTGASTNHTYTWNAYSSQLTDGSNVYTWHAPAYALCNDVAQDNATLIDTHTAGACDSYIDPAGFASCGPQPGFNPFDSTTYPLFQSWLIYWPQCLFDPKGGFDSNHELQNAWNTSAAGTVQTDIAEVGDILPAADECGDLIPGSGIPLETDFVQLDTCTWSPWAPAARTFIALAMTVIFGFWAVGFVLTLVRSVAGAPESPWGEGEKWDDARLF